jgi:hypothetical protein
MPQVQQVAELERRVLAHLGHPALPAPVRAELDQALAELGLTASALPRYRAALAHAVEAAGRDLDDVLTELATAPVAFLGPVHRAVRPVLEGARRAGVDLDAGIDLGPAGLYVVAPIATVRPDPAAAAGVARAALAHLPISGIAAGLDLGPIDASGAGFLDGQRRAAGALLRADLGFARADAALLLDARDGVTVLALLRAEFRPTGIQLGLGFSLDAVGGLVGVHRSVDADRLRDRMADGSALDALFGGGGTGPEQARATLAALADAFPPRTGTHVVGPTLRLGWMTVMGGSLARLDVGLILVLPEGRVVLPGRIVVEVPGPGLPLLHLRLDVLGEVDVPGRRLALDAALVDSQAMGTLTVTGTAAVRLAWGGTAVVLATVGGFYPGFRPDPVVVPPQRRIGIALASPIPAGLRISLEGYVATAAGTLQAGAKATVALEIVGTGVSGSVGFDAIVQLAPLWFEAQVHGSVSVRALGRRLAGVDLRGTLTGPGPMVLTVTATAEILGLEVGGTESFTLSDRPGADRAPFDGIAGVVRSVLADAAHVAGDGGGDADVVLAPRPASDGVPLLAPGATLTWSQEAFPLGDPFGKAAGRTLREPVTVTVTTPGSRTDVTRRLTTAAYTTIRPKDALAVPPFEARRAGWILAPVRAAGAPHPVDTIHRTVVLPVHSPLDRLWRLRAGAPRTVDVTAALRALDHPAAPSGGVGPAVTVHPEPWVASPGGATHWSGAAAQAHATLISGGAARPAAAMAEVDLP